MKTVKTLLVVAAMFLSVTAMAQYGQRGQGQRGQGQRMTLAQRAERETARIHQAVELSDKQIADIYVINLKYATADSVRMVEMRAQREQNQGQSFDFEAMRKQMQERQDAKSAEIKAVLTDAQKEKYDAMLKEEAERRAQWSQQRGQGRGPQGRGGQGGPRE